LIKAGMTGIMMPIPMMSMRTVANIKTNALLLFFIHDECPLKF
jgi:hypothetical protein